MKIDLLQEANRCLNCKKPLCKIHCPISTDIPNIINLFKENKIDEAGEILFTNNPLSIFCSIVCPHEEQCKGHCIKGIKETPVEFPLIEKEISTEYLSKLPLNKKENKKIDITLLPLSHNLHIFPETEIRTHLLPHSDKGTDGTCAL